MERNLPEVFSEHVKGKQELYKRKLCWTPRVATAAW